MLSQLHYVVINGFNRAERPESLLRAILYYKTKIVSVHSHLNSIALAAGLGVLLLLEGPFLLQKGVISYNIRDDMDKV
jgi:hypothetical protein